MRSSEISAQRRSCLKHIADTTNSENVLLWLFDRTTNTRTILLSYIVSSSCDSSAEFVGRSVDVAGYRYNTKTPLLVDPEAELELRIQLESLGYDDRRFVFFQVCLPPEALFGTSEEDIERFPIGIVALDGDPLAVDPQYLLLKMQFLALQIQYGRKRRIIDAVDSTQKLLKNTSSDTEGIVIPIGLAAMHDIGANKFFLSNKEAGNVWRRVDSLDSNVCHMEESLHAINDYSLNAGSNFIDRITISYDENGELQEDAVIIYLRQSAFALRPTPLSKISDFLGELDTCMTAQVRMIYATKSGDGYLQEKFSETDVGILRAIFNYIEQYVEAKLFDEHFANVTRYSTETTDPCDPTLLLAMLRRMSLSFTNVYLISVEFSDSGSELEVTSADNDDKLSSNYLNRIKTDYFDRYFSAIHDFSTDMVRIGLECRDHTTDIEVHFPISPTYSKCIVIRYDSKVVSESILRSLMQLFNELQVWNVRNSAVVDRANYLMQVRHAVVHHFSAANKSIKVVRRVWEKGVKNKLYWDALVENKIANEALMRGVWSLTQAQLIIENGRFIIGELQANSLNRKQVRIVDIVNDCLYALEDQRSEKSIRIISRIVGNIPSTMNADELLLRVALLNLFDNALKYSLTGKPMRWVLKFYAKHYRFEVSNAGEPLKPYMRASLFQFGVRGKQRDRLNQRHGTGLGLSVAEKILKAHWQECELDFYGTAYDSEIGAPANTFFFEMPYLTGQSPPKAETEQG